MLETIVTENDELIESWYLLAFACVKLKKYTEAEDACKNVRDVAKKNKVVNAELEAATLEIYQEVRKYLDKEEADMEAEDKNVGEDDDGFVTCSDDDESSDDDDKDDDNEEMKE